MGSEISLLNYKFYNPFRHDKGVSLIYVFTPEQVFVHMYARMHVCMCKMKTSHTNYH